MNKSDSHRLKVYFFLHALLLIYSLSSVVSKYASTVEFLSLKFFICYFLIFLLLGVYAIGWQQVIKHMSLTEAFANKSVTVIWGIIWGFFLFSEGITLTKIIGACLVVAGIILFAFTGDDDGTAS